MNQFDVILFVWLCSTTLATLFTPNRFQIQTVTLSTIILLGCFYPFSLGWMMGTVCFSYMIYKSTLPQRNKGIWGTVGLVFIMLLFYKYLQIKLGNIPWPLPALIGMSYFFCRQIHFLIDATKQHSNQVSFIEFLNYNFFLPVMFAGPIHRLPNFLRQCQRRRITREYVSGGLERILYGYSKLIIGNFFINYQLKSVIELLEVNVVLAMFIESTTDWLYLYIQFSGYTDVALGFALLLGVKLEENFNNPLAATNIIDFWLRWHITLSSWCRDYIFNPVQALLRNQLIGVIFAMIAMGLWHELSLYYLLWGFYHAAGIAICRTYQQSNDPLQFRKLPTSLKNGITRSATFFWLISGMPIISTILSFIL